MQTNPPALLDLQTARCWFDNWFIPQEEELWSFVRLVRSIQFEVKLTQEQRLAGMTAYEPWEAAADILIRDLPRVVLQHAAIDTGPDSYTAALARLLLAAKEIRNIAVKPATGPKTSWHYYAVQIFDQANVMARAAGVRKSGLAPTSNGIIVTTAALLAAGINLTVKQAEAEHETVSTTLKRAMRKQATRQTRD